ncbi:MAG: galactonate dehydratase [Planctomycetes bacterium SM23_32]|nr:MAG: galactonate dehydratase [Planctomycetes bacterium SM23_32]
MKITALQTFFVKPRWLFLKMHTDQGLVGWGEPVVEGWSQSVAAAVREMGRHLIGKDPRRVEHHWQAIYRGGFYQGGPVLTSALSGIEQAMWDVKGKALGVPVHDLLGGAVRDRIRLYGHVGWSRREDYFKDADLASRGFTAVKTSLFEAVRFVEGKAFVDEVAARMAALRDTFGDAVDIAVDFHGRVSPPMAIRLAAALEPYQPMFIEEPVLPGNVDALARVARSTTIPIATGERLYTKWAFREVLEKGAAAILQPDLSHAGGILEVRKIAAMAEAHYAAIAPHCPLGPISLAACLQVDACTPNFLCQEQVNLGDGYLKEPFVVRDGYIAVPTGPGLGVEVDEEALAEKLYDGSWENPRLWHEDGSVADW